MKAKPFRLTDEQSKLVGDNYGLAIAAAEHFSGLYQRMSRDDLISACAEGLCRAASTYDAGKSAFSTYAWEWMRHSVRKEWADLGGIHIPVYLTHAGKSDKRNPDLVAMAERSRSTTSSDRALSGLPSRERQVGHEIESREEIEKMMRFMTPTQRIIIECLADGATGAILGKMLGCNKENARAAGHRARESAKRAIGATA